MILSPNMIEWMTCLISGESGWDWAECVLKWKLPGTWTDSPIWSIDWPTLLISKVDSNLHPTPPSRGILSVLPTNPTSWRPFSSWMSTPTSAIGITVLLLLYSEFISKKCIFLRNFRLFRYSFQSFPSSWKQKDESAKEEDSHSHGNAGKDTLTETSIFPSLPGSSTNNSDRLW